MLLLRASHATHTISFIKINPIFLKTNILLREIMHLSLKQQIIIQRSGKRYVVKHNCQLRCLMTILDNYMFRPLLVIFRFSLRELKVLLYNVRARDGEISTSGLRNS